MRNLFRVLILISFVMSLSSCELFDPKLWAEVRERQEAAGFICDGHGNCGYTRPYCTDDGERYECSSSPY